MSPLSVPNFSAIGACIRVLWWILQSVRKEEELEEEKKQRKKTLTLATCISEITLAIFFKFGMRTPYLAGTSVATLVSMG